MERINRITKLLAITNKDDKANACKAAALLIEVCDDPELDSVQIACKVVMALHSGGLSMSVLERVLNWYKVKPKTSAALNLDAVMRKQLIAGPMRLKLRQEA